MMKKSYLTLISLFILTGCSSNDPTYLNKETIHYYSTSLDETNEIFNNNQIINYKNITSYEEFNEISDSLKEDSILELDKISKLTINEESFNDSSLISLVSLHTIYGIYYKTCLTSNTLSEDTLNLSFLQYEPKSKGESGVTLSYYHYFFIKSNDKKDIKRVNIDFKIQDEDELILKEYSESITLTK